MLDTDKHFEAIRALVAEVLDVQPSKIEGSTSLNDELDADSMDVVNILIGLDELYDAGFDPRDLPDGAVTLDWIVDHVKAKLAAAGR